MKSALYFPILRGKRGEITALGHLSPVARAWMRPTIDLPKPGLASKLSFEDFLSDIGAALARNWGNAYPVFVDFSQYGPDETTSNGIHPAEYFFDLARQHGVKGIPVAGPISIRGPGLRYLDSVSRVARRDRRGIAIRVPFQEFARSDSLEAICAATLDAVAISSDSVDVILDLEAVARLTPEERTGIALQAVVTEAIRSLARWRFRTVVLCGSSLPEHVGKRHDWNPLRVSRTEVDVWSGLLGLGDLPIVRFGDYGVAFPFESDTTKPVRPPSRVRLSSPQEHLIYRAKPNEYRALCSAVLRDIDGALLPECWGAQELSRCASGAPKVGGATEWVARDTNVHLEATAQLVAGEFRRRDLLSRIDLESPRSIPWLQRALTIGETE
jgi:hypothetical protein